VGGLAIPCDIIPTSYEEISVSVGYLEVLRASPDFRRLFAGRLISLFGDWFSMVAIVALLREVVGSDPRALGSVLVLRLLPFFFAGPLAGVVADRFSRKAVMIVSDLLRCVLVMGLLLAPLSPRPLLVVYSLIALHVVTSAFFEPARGAALPQLVRREHLAAANALGAIAWSLTFAVGAALGGLVTDWFGWRVALTIDAATYLLSVWFIWRIVLPPRAPRSTAVDWRSVTGLRDFSEGIRFVRRVPAVAAVIFIKTGWGLAGAITLLLMLFGERAYAAQGREDLGVALMLSARALGTGIGPVLARRWVSDESVAGLRRLIVASFLCPVIGYLCFSFSHSPWTAALWVMVAHFGGSVLWVYSSLLLQKLVPDAFLGRVMSTDLGLATLTIAASTWFYGIAAETVDLRLLVRLMALSLLLPTAIWILFAGRRLVNLERRS